MMIALDNNGKQYDIDISDNTYMIKKSDIDLRGGYIEITDESFNAKVGDEGYYVIADCQNKGSYLCKFTNHADYEIELKQNLMPRYSPLKNLKTLYWELQKVLTIIFMLLSA